MCNYYQTLSTLRLNKEVKELERKLASAKSELAGRGGNDLNAWMCDECGLQNADPEVVIQHLMDVHGYPEEDASISTVQVYL